MTLQRDRLVYTVCVCMRVGVCVKSVTCLKMSSKLTTLHANNNLCLSHLFSSVKVYSVSLFERATDVISSFLVYKSAHCASGTEIIAAHINYSECLTIDNRPRKMASGSASFTGRKNTEAC